MTAHFDLLTPVIFGIFFNSLYCLLFGINFLIIPENRSSNFILSLFLFCDSAWLCMGGISAMGFDAVSSVFLFKLSILFYFFTAFTSNLYFLVLSTPDFTLRPRQLLHAVGPVVAIVLFFIEKNVSASEDFFSLYYLDRGDSILSSFTSLVLFGYSIFIIYVFIKIFRMRASAGKFSAGWSKILLFVIYGIILQVLWSVDKIYSMEYLWHLYFLTGCFPIFASFIVAKDPGFLYLLKEEFELKQ